MNNPDSFLCKFYGVYTIKVPYMGELTCCIMNNLVG